VINDRLVLYSLSTRRDWLCSSSRLRFYHLACLRFSAELFLFVIFSTFSFVLVQLFLIYRLSFRSLRNHHLTLPLFTTLNTRKKLKRDYLRRLFEGTIWEGPFEGERTGEKYLIRGDGTEYWGGWGKTWTNRQVLLIEILSNRVVCLNIPFRPLLSNISPSSSSSQMVFLKWFLE
jgi:hypothetical protein